MGLFSSLASSFMEGWRSGQQAQHPPTRSTQVVPRNFDLIYPAPLLRFDEIAAGGHDDPRALVYALSWLDPKRKRPFACGELNALDFGNGKDGEKKACQTLLKRGLICNLAPDRVLAEIYTVQTLKDLLRQRGLPVSGNKSVLVDRVMSSGFKISGRSYRYKFLELTESGIGKIKESRADEKQAFFMAVSELKEQNYPGAISAYRSFDSKWGFVHTSGKNHTIFAHYDVPFSQFDFIAGYPMRELQNSDDFKATLRACLIAGLMGKGCPDYVGEAFQEPIQCPNIVSYYAQGHFDDGINPDTIAAMQENVELDNSYVLQYYISRVMYLSRQARK